MSRTPFFYLEKYNSETDTYELVEPYVKDSKNNKRGTPVDLFPYEGAHEMFAILEGFAMNGIHRRLPPRVSKEIPEILYEDIVAKDEFDELERQDRKEKNVRWFTYADMEIYLLKHPTVKSEYKDEPTFIENPVFQLKHRVDAFLDICESWGWEDDKSFIRIVFWIE